MLFLFGGLGGFLFVFQDGVGGVADACPKEFNIKGAVSRPGARRAPPPPGESPRILRGGGGGETLETNLRKQTTFHPHLDDRRMWSTDSRRERQCHFEPQPPVAQFPLGVAVSLVVPGQRSPFSQTLKFFGLEFRAP